MRDARRPPSSTSRRPQMTGVSRSLTTALHFTAEPTPAVSSAEASINDRVVERRAPSPRGRCVDRQGQRGEEGRQLVGERGEGRLRREPSHDLSLIHISEPTRLALI
eukprot:13176240-Alexandrium_andersonii.AAC.1